MDTENKNSLSFSVINSFADWEKALNACEYSLNPDLFDINIGYGRQIEKRKRKVPHKQFSDLEELHEHLRRIIECHKTSILTTTVTPDGSRNDKAKSVSARIMDNCELAEMCVQLSVLSGSENNDAAQGTDHRNPFNQLITNSTDKWEEVKVLSHTYLQPPRSGFIMSDIKFATPLLTSLNQKFDLILLDPPVRNKSVSQYKAYGFLDEDDLLELPVKEMAAEGALLAVWCTNSDKFADSVNNCLFPAWSVQSRADITWLKVTKSGDPVLDLNDRFRRPYEKLFLGRFVPHPREHNYHDDPLFELTDHVILSVPCSFHSAKPNLQEFLSSFLPENPRCLELFARNVYPGWTSWGNEPLKFLRKDVMVPKPI